LSEEEPYRHVAFGGQRVEVFATGSNSKSIVDTLFLDAPAGDKEVICCRFTVHDRMLIVSAWFGMAPLAMELEAKTPTVSGNVP
jgi:hypothetical protein